MRRVFSIVVTAAVALAAVGCGGASDVPGSRNPPAGQRGSDLALVAYSTPQVVYDQIIPDFAATEAGREVNVTTSYGPSGEQSRAVEAGLAADVVTFSIEPDVTRLVKAGLVADDWNRGPSKGLVTTSVVSFIVRKGNPKGITGWDDLLKPGVEVVTPNPFTSGAAKWNLLGAYAHGGLPFVTSLIRDHVKVQPKSGREALQTFTGGKGDVLISYEYEATTARKKGQAVDYVIPADTVKIDIDIARTIAAPPSAQAFIDYVLSGPAQRRFADWGYRPVNKAVLAATRDLFPTPAKLTTIDDLGGWSKLNKELFDPESGSIAAIEEDAGVSTAK